MPSLKRLVRYNTGWLAIPASLLLMFSGCQTDEPAKQTVASPSHHSASKLFEEGSPFHKVFNGEADFVVLTFFDLYCIACQQSADNFKTLGEQIPVAFPDTKIQVTGVGIGDTELELSVFLRKYKLGYDCLPDAEKEFEDPFAIRGTPTVLVFQRIGSDCQEIYRHEGRFRLDDLEQMVAKVKEHL